MVNSLEIPCLVPVFLRETMELNNSEIFADKEDRVTEDTRNLGLVVRLGLDSAIMISTADYTVLLR